MKFKWLLLNCIYSVSALAEPSVVNVKGHNVEYEVAGKGKHTIFLEAGGGAGLSDWDPVFEALAKTAKVIRYSRVGNGASDKVQRNYSSEEFAQEAYLILGALNVEGPVVYVAHSYGAYIARRFAATYPETVSALMLIEPASEHDVAIMRKIDLAQAEIEIAQIKLDDLSNGMSNQYLDFWSKRPLPDYPKIPDIPVTVIASTKKYEDPQVLFFTDKARVMWGELQSKWVNDFPQGKVVLTEKSYHYPQNDEPEMVVKEISELLTRINR